MKKVTIKVNGVPYPVKFGYGAIRLLGSIWKLNGFVEVVEKVGSLVPSGKGKNFDLSFENLDCIGDIIWAGITNASNNEVDVQREEAVDAFFQDMESLATVFELFMESMPSQKEPVEPPKKKRTPKKAS